MSTRAFTQRNTLLL